MRLQYLDTAKLLVRIAPAIFHDATFALKGGTAINLFVREMPRLSIDLDLAFRDHKPDRKTAMERIENALQISATRLQSQGYSIQAPTTSDGHETKLFVQREALRVKVEANYVTRGTVEPVQELALRPRASQLLLAELRLPTVSLADLYGGKIVAAMDRQHPRDLFDVMELLENEGITPAIRQAFVIYLASHDRPVHEVLFPQPKDVSYDFTHGFKGMAERAVSLEDLVSARSRMIETLHAQLTENERAFLLTLVRNEPQWDLLDVPHAKELPAIKWKLRNLEALQRDNPKKFAAQYETLSQRLKLIE